MNKKFLSVILFSALMVGSAGTFTSCKDYDDDIDQINKELTDIRSIITDLQGKIGDGKFVTNVEKGADGLVITWNDKTTNTIAFDKEQGGNFPEITIDPATGNWLVDGEDTGFSAKGDKGDNGVNAKSPSIDPKTGNWVVYEWDAEKQEYVPTDTGISAKGASTYVVENGNYYELHVATDETGAETTVIKLPKTPTTITEIEVLGILNDVDGVGSVSGKEIHYNYTFIKDLNKKQTAWNAEDGVKKLAKGQVLSTLDNSEFLIRVAPAALDASEFEFTLVNSTLAEAPMELGTPAAYNGLLTRAAVSGNGLWSINTSAIEGLTYEKEAQYTAQFVAGKKAILYALQEKEGFTTLYDLSFEKSENIELDAKVKAVNGKNVKSPRATKYTNTELQNFTDATVNLINLGKVEITFDKKYAVYDAHLHFDAATIKRWDIQYVEGTTFTVGDRADLITPANFQVEVHYVTLDGSVKSEFIPLKVAKSYAEVTELPSKNIEIAADNSKNKFENSLQPMFNNIGENLDLWKADVETVEFTYQQLGTKPNDPTAKWMTTQILNAKVDKDVTAEATKIIVNLVEQYHKSVTLGIPCRVVIEFKDKDGAVLSTAIQPVTFSIPKLSEFLVKEHVVFGGTNAGKAYMNEEDKQDAAGVWKSRYAFKHAFKNFKKGEGVFANGSTITFAIDANQKFGDAAVTSLAKLTGSAEDYAIELTNTEKAYAKDINIVISEAKYLGVYAYSEEERKANAFSLKVMSPIEQGVVEAANGAIIDAVATADGTAVVTESDFKATTYANVAYKLFKDKFNGEETTASLFSSPYLKSVDFESANENAFTVKETNAAEKDGKGNITEGNVVLKAKNAAYEVTEKLNVTVTDNWGYTKKASIDVKVKPVKE